MWKSALLAVLTFGSASVSATLTEVETKWLQAGLPVLAYAKTQSLPVDVIVQPQAPAGAAPLAMGFVDGRCKLVLSMRGNPRAEDMLAGVEPALVPLVIEAMTAHELGHCWRHVRGAWHGLPAGFVLDAAARSDGAAREAWQEMRATRREEGFADLVGLAWTLNRHPQQYAAVHAWFERVRFEQPVAGSHHDTRAWVALAKQASAFPSGSTPFDQAQALWQTGLREVD